MTSSQDRKRPEPKPVAVGLATMLIGLPGPADQIVLTDAPGWSGRKVLRSRFAGYGCRRRMHLHQISCDGVSSGRTSRAAAMSPAPIYLAQVTGWEIAA